MTNATQKLTISDIQQATTIAELTRLWGLSQDPDACEKPASCEAVGGKLLETCINNFPTCTAFGEVKEICEALHMLGLGRTKKGCVLIRQVIGKWLTLCTTEAEADEVRLAHTSYVPI
jgi:hypothetical protein